MRSASFLHGVLGAALFCGIVLMGRPAMSEDLHGLPKERQLTLAFLAAFGEEGAAEVEWDGIAYLYKPQDVVWLGDTAILVTTGENWGAAHVQTGWLGIHYLETTPAGFVRGGNWARLVPGNGFGQAPAFQLRDDLSDAPVILVESSYTAQGITTGVASLVELLPDGPAIVAELAGSCTNEGWAEKASDLRTANLVIKPAVRGKSFVAAYSGKLAVEVLYERGIKLFRRAETSPLDPDCEAIMKVD